MLKMPLRCIQWIASRTTVLVTLAALILVSVLTIPTSVSAAQLAKSCTELHQQNPSAPDGEYTLNLQGHSAHIYCTGMFSTPKEYITLALTGPSSNYSFFPGQHVLHGYQYGLVVGTDAWTSYLKIHIDPVTLVVDQNDFTFINPISIGSNGNDWTNPNFNPTPRTAAYANASDCYKSWSSRGRANVNLTGTDFAIDDSVTFATGGFAANGNYTMDAGRQVVSMTGGGWCGGTGPQGPLKLKLLTPLLDSTPPVTTIAAPTTWQNKDVPVTFTATDNLSGVAATYYTVDGGVQQTGTSPILSTEGVHTLTYWSVDNAGNAEAAHTAIVKIDKTPPTITGATDRAANANGWYNADVKVTFTCADPLSGGVASGVASCSASTTLHEGQGQSVTGNAADVAGNTASATVSGINIDKTAPVTTATPDRAANSNGWYKANVSVTLAATDNLSGAAKTEYNLDGAGWTVYTTPVAMSFEGIHTLLYRSTDKADNVEATHSLTIRIDKTPPEAYLQFDPVSHDIQLFGRDALSGLANPGPIAPVSVTPILGEDRGQKGNQKGDDNSRAETRTYLVKDLADNTLQLLVQVQKEGHDIKARVVSLQYNGGTVIAPLQDVLSWNWELAKDGSLKVLEQRMGLVDGLTRAAVEAHYDARKNVTWIVHSQPEGQSDDNKSLKGRDDGEYPGAVKLPGMVLLRLTSSQGHLMIEVPGL
jgi:hypothetical protein